MNRVTDTNLSTASLGRLGVKTIRISYAITFVIISLRRIRGSVEHIEIHWAMETCMANAREEWLVRTDYRREKLPERLDMGQLTDAKLRQPAAICTRKESIAV